MTHDWHDDALCVSSADRTLWDGHRDGEPPETRAKRQALAIAICKRCPVGEPCLAEAELGADDGVRNGIVLPPVVRPRRESVGTNPTARRHGTEWAAQQHRKRGEPVCGPCLEAERFARNGRRAS